MVKLEKKSIAIQNCMYDSVTDMICLTIFDHTYLVHAHWLAFCIYMIVRYVKRDFLYTQLKYYNKYALEITYNWLSFIPHKFQ